MKYYLGVDAGGSKTDAIILDEDGNIIGLGRAGAGNYEVVGVEGAKKNWLLAIERAKGDLRITSFEKACFGLAGADFPEDFEMLEKEIKSLNIAKEFCIENDATIALRAGSKDFWGIIIIMGSGTNGYGRRRDGRSFRFYGEGYAFGDWGGASSVVQEMLHCAFRSYDGRGDKTILEDMALEFFGAKNFDELAKRLYYHHEEWRKALEFAPYLFKAIENGDKVAIGIGEKIVDETVRAIYALMSKLELFKEETPIVLGGSLFKGADWLKEYISAKVHIFSPKSIVSVLKAPPVLGAGILAWEMDGKIITWEKWNKLQDYDFNSSLNI
ncbi:MAG: kinase [Dictyoglomus sp. NZ13-RE01]|nr:MAG: kinase [Dictyoglomus sp. NZ13-RE01]